MNPPDMRKRVLQLAWPAVLMNLFQTLALTLDVIMVGRLGKEAIGGVTLGGQVMFVVLMVFMTITAGTIALMARFTGSGEKEPRAKALGQSILLALSISTPVVIMGLLFPHIIVSIYGAETIVASIAERYVSIVLMGTPLFAMMSVATAAHTAIGDTRTPLVVNGTMNLVNVFFNYALIFGKFGFPRLGVEGAAWGTFISFVWGAAIFIMLLMRKRGKFSLKLGSLSPDRPMVKRILNIGFPAMGEQLAVQIGFIIYMILIVRFGSSALAAHSIGIRIQSLAFMPALGFSTAATALTGQYLGSKKPDMAEKTAWYASKLSLLTMGSAGAFLFVLAPYVAKVFIDDQEVINLAVVFIRILALGIPAIAIHFSIAGSLRGAGDTKYPLYATIVGFYGIRIPLAIFLGFFTPMRLFGVWVAMISEYYVRMIIIGRRFESGKWKETKV